MDDQKRLEDKVDKIVDKICSIDVTLVKQSIILEEHIKRTNLLEDKIEPIEKHVIMVNGVLKFLGIVAIFIGIIEGLIKIIVG
jgi:hypothetical protein